MGFSDDQIHDILELKEQLVEKIEKRLKEIEKLEKNISVLDTILKQTSFTKASDLTLNTEKKKGVVPIIKNSDGSTIATVFISDDKLSIILDKNILLNSKTPPLKTFFLDRIIGEMKNKDNQEVEKGKIGKDDVIDCVISNNGNAIREIIIKNYRQKERVDEIINTATWSLTRMLENSV
tara:strand:- start:37 stop:573 length:537 start_codon:yes stop_codon:yes gene_type:complete